MEMRSRTTAVQLDRILEAINRGNAQQLSIQKEHSASLKNMTQKYFSLEGRMDVERAERLAAFQDMGACHTNSFQILHEYVEDNQVKTGQEISKLWAVLNSVRSPNSQPTSVDSSSDGSGSGSAFTFASTLNSVLSPMSDACNETDVTESSVFDCESVVLLPPTLKRECANTVQGSVPVPFPIVEVTAIPTALSLAGAHPEDREPELEIASSAPKSVPTSTSIPRIPIRSKTLKKIPGHRKKTATCKYCKNEVGLSYLKRHQKNTCKMAT